MFTDDEASAFLREAEAFEFKLKTSELEDPIMMELTESERSVIEKVSRMDSGTVYTREDVYTLLGILDGLESMSLVGLSYLAESARAKMHKFLEPFQTVLEKPLKSRLEDLKELEAEFLEVVNSDLSSLERFERISFLVAVMRKEHLLPTSHPDYERVLRELERMYRRMMRSLPHRYNPY